MNDKEQIKALLYEIVNMDCQPLDKLRALASVYQGWLDASVETLNGLNSGFNDAFEKYDTIDGKTIPSLLAFDHIVDRTTFHMNNFLKETEPHRKKLFRKEE